MENQNILAEKKEAQLYTTADLVSALKATRMEYEGISIAETAKAFQEAKWSKGEVETLVRELTSRYG